MDGARSQGNKYLNFESICDGGESTLGGCMLSVLTAYWGRSFISTKNRSGSCEGQEACKGCRRSSRTESPGSPVRGSVGERQKEMC